MNRLVLDTCFAACSVAVISPARTWTLVELMQRGHAERLIGMIDEVMQDAGLAFTDLDEIIVTTGPGTFTGMRVGIAAARGLALASGIPLAGLSSLQLMAWGAQRQLQAVAADDVTSPGAHDSFNANASIAIAVDARKEQIYLQCFTSQGGAVTEPQVLSPAAALEYLPRGPVIALGSGAETLLQAWQGTTDASPVDRLTAALPDMQPDARDLGHHPLPPAARTESVKPLYLRPPDAKPQQGKSVARAT